MNLRTALLHRGPTALVIGAGLMLSACMSAPKAPAAVAGDVLAGPNGMTLYVFDRDQAAAGRSVCNGPCAQNWPPLSAAADAAANGDYSVITRDDGSRQWAYKGRPLYYWIKDGKPGDRSGDGFNNVWHVARP